MTRISWIVFAAAVLLYMLARWQGVTQTEDGRAIHEARQALHTGKAYRARQDSVQRLVSAAVRTVWYRDTVIVRLDGRLMRDTSARDSVRTLLQVRDTLIAQRDSLRSAVRFLTIRGDTAEARVEALNTHLANVLAIAECHVMGIKLLPKCPSRTASFLLGGGIVGLAILSVKH